MSLVSYQSVPLYLWRHNEGEMVKGLTPVRRLLQYHGRDGDRTWAKGTHSAPGTQSPALLPTPKRAQGYLEKEEMEGWMSVGGREDL